MVRFCKYNIWGLRDGSPYLIYDNTRYENLRNSNVFQQALLSLQGLFCPPVYNQSAFQQFLGLNVRDLYIGQSTDAYYHQPAFFIE